MKITRFSAVAIAGIMLAFLLTASIARSSPVLPPDHSSAASHSIETATSRDVPASVDVGANVMAQPADEVAVVTLRTSLVLRGAVTMKKPHATRSVYHVS